MFDIGFWEIMVIAVVALLVVGPDEFPTMVRNVSGWISKIRRFMSDTKDELDREFTKADELKRLLEREASLAELHERVDARKIDRGASVDSNKPPERAGVSPVMDEMAVDTASVAEKSDAQSPTTSSPRGRSSHDATD